MKKFLCLAAIFLMGTGTVLAASSMENRAEKSYYVGLSPFGFHIPTLASQPKAFGMYFGPNIMLGIEAGGVNYDAGSEVDGSLSGDFSNTGVFARLFPRTNSFNFLLAVHQRVWSMGYDFTITEQATSTPITVGAGVKASATVFTFGLSNHWMSDLGITWGFDWLALSLPLSQSSDFNIEDPLGAADEATAEGEVDEAIKALNILSYIPGLFIFSIGFSF